MEGELKRLFRAAPSQPYTRQSICAMNESDGIQPSSTAGESLVLNVGRHQRATVNVYLGAIISNGNSARKKIRMSQTARSTFVLNGK